MTSGPKVIDWGGELIFDFYSNILNSLNNLMWFLGNFMIKILICNVFSHHSILFSSKLVHSLVTTMSATNGSWCFK